MGKSEEVLTDSIKKEMRRQFIDFYNYLGRYIDDEQKYDDEVLTTGSELDMAFNRVRTLAEWRSNFAKVAAKADVTVLAAALDEVSAPPAAPPVPGAKV